MRGRPIAILMATVAAMLLAPAGCSRPASQPSTAAFSIVATTFPIHQLTRVVTDGDPGVRVELLLPAGLGCPHDYLLTPNDLQKIERADLLVTNGLGMEEFLGAPLRQAGGRLKVIDASEGSHAELLPAHGQDRAGGHDGHAGHDGHNPHLFASPRMAARLVIAIASGLATIRPEQAALYRRNADRHAASMQGLADEFSRLGPRLKNRRIVTQHDAFAYLARDVGLEVIGVVQSHPGHDPAASEMFELVQTIRERQARAVFVEPQYPAGMAGTLAREAGLPLATLDPAASGPEGAALDHYERTMRANLDTLRRILGGD